MRLCPENLARHELIGLDVKVEASSNKSQVGLSGRVTDETRNTILLDTGRRVLRLAKGKTALIFTLPSGQIVRICGSILISQPENRINKRMQRTRWKL